MRVLAALLVLAACDAPAPREVRIDLAVRGSCGTSTRLYDTSCVAALELRLVDGRGEVLAEQCTAVAGRYTTLDALVASREVLEVLEAAPARDGVAVELRGHHAFDRDPCDELSESSLMLWGRSEPVDLGDDALHVVTVQLECRPSCDCAALGVEAGCGTALEPGLCVPSNAASPCRRGCDDAGDCYGGLLVCSAGGLCEPAATDGMCASCAAAAECAAGLSCLHRAERDAGGRTLVDETMCAARCPPLGGVAPCPERMSCRRVDGERYTLVP